MDNRGRFKNVFWGLHTDQHANAIDTMLCRDLTVEYLVEKLKKINPDFVQCDCKGHPGYTSYPTEVGTTCPGLIQDNLKIWREATEILDIPLFMHYSGVIDNLAIKQHPEWAVIGHDGENGCRWGMGMACPNSDYDDKLMIPQMIEIVEKYNVDGFWIDGENWGVLPCYCEKCRKQFKDEYGIDKAPESENDENWDLWLSMIRKNFERHIDKVCKAVHAVKEDCLICSNWAYTLRQPESVNTDVDIISGDSWNLERTNCEVRIIENQGKMWNLMPWGFSKSEMRCLNTTDSLCQKSASIISRGGAVLMYEIPIRTSVYNDKEFRQLAQVEKFIRAREPYLKGSKLLPQVAVLHSKENYYSLNEPVYMIGDVSIKPIEGAVNLSLASGYETTILTTDNLKTFGSEFPIIIAPEQNKISDETLKLLKEYAKGGATVIISGAELCKKFEDVLGGTCSDLSDCQKLGYMEIQDMPLTANNYLKFVPNNAKTLKKLLYDRGVGRIECDTPYTAISETPYGKGKIVAIFGDFFAPAQVSGIPAPRYVLKEILDSVEDDRLIRVNGPAYVQPSIRTKDEKIVVALVNISTDYPMMSDNGYCEKVPYAGPVTIEMKLDNEPFNVYNVPSMDPVDYTYKDGILTAKLENVHILDMLVIEK